MPSSKDGCHPAVAYARACVLCGLPSLMELPGCFGCARPTGIPESTINLEGHHVVPISWTGGSTSISEVSGRRPGHVCGCRLGVKPVWHRLCGAFFSRNACVAVPLLRVVRCWLRPVTLLLQVTTVQLEWEKLTHHTKDPKYAACVRRAMRAVRAVQPADGLHPMFIHPGTGAGPGGGIRACALQLPPLHTHFPSCCVRQLRCRGSARSSSHHRPVGHQCCV
jgi:hypothetical protein